MKNSWIKEKDTVNIRLTERTIQPRWLSRKKTTIQLIGGGPKKKKKERGDRDNDLVPVEKQLNGIEEICNDLLCGRRKKEKEKASIKLRRETHRGPIIDEKWTNTKNVITVR